MEDPKKALKTLEKALNNCEVSKGDRRIVVLDRGWIFAGKLKKRDDGSFFLSDCVNVRRWESVGFGGLTKGAKSAKAVLDASNPIEFSASAVIFCVPISEEWENE